MNFGGSIKLPFMYLFVSSFVYPWNLKLVNLQYESLIIYFKKLNHKLMILKLFMWNYYFEFLEWAIVQNDGTLKVMLKKRIKYTTLSLKNTNYYHSTKYTQKNIFCFKNLCIKDENGKLRPGLQLTVFKS